MLSVRTITNLAQASPSSIDYHFGNLEHLLACAQKVALNKAKAWLGTRLDELQPLVGFELLLEQRVSVIAAILDDWTTQEPSLAWAAMEASSSARHCGDAAQHAAWLELWQEFWQSVAIILGMPQAANLLFVFHQGQGPQHFLKSNRALDRALLDEDIALLLAPDLRRHSRHGAIRKACVAAIKEGRLTSSRASAEENPDTIRSAVEASAAAILCEQGLAALNYRSVAKRAGYTLGQVSWIFKSRAELLEGGFMRLYTDMAIVPRPAEPIPAGVLLDHTIATLASGKDPLLLALHDIIMHIARQDDHAALRAPFRVFSDPAAVWVLAWLLNMTETEAASLAPIFGSLCRGIDYVAQARADDRGAQALAEEVLQNWCKHCLGEASLISV